MIALRELIQQHLTLGRRHCQEQKTFHTAEIAIRCALGQNHRRERTGLQTSQFTACELAALLFQQVSEIMEFRILHQERWFCLLDRQNREKDDFEESLKLAG